MSPVRTVKKLSDVVDRQRETDAAFLVEARLGDADDLAGVGDKNGRAAFARHDRERHFERVLADRGEAPRIERGRQTEAFVVEFVRNRIAEQPELAPDVTLQMRRRAERNRRQVSARRAEQREVEIVI